jgi:integrase
MAKALEPVNVHAGEPVPRAWTVGRWIREAFLPFIRRKWKLSTASTSGDRIRKHLISDFDSVELASVTRDMLQRYLEQKATGGCSFSVVDHLRWDVRAIFRLAVQDRVLLSNPADLLFTPRNASRPCRQVLTAEQVRLLLDQLNLREQLIVQLALFSGMRPGEILALQWKHVADDHVQVVHRIYRGKLDRPKSERSKRQVALTASTRELMRQWKEKTFQNADAWVFSTSGDLPLSRDNVWRRSIRPKLAPLGLEWATFQILRRTHASVSRKVGIDPKLVADQLGHGLGVNLDIYTVAALDQRRQAVEVLEASFRQ